MKVLHTRTILKAFFLVSGFALILSSCKDDGETPAKPTIIEFSPSTGVVGETVIITGTNFSVNPSKNIVKFNGAVATVTEATSTELTLTVPGEASTGKITVATNGASAESISDFTVPDPTIVSYTPSIAGTGVPVTITGTNFSLTKENNIVKFNGLAGVVTSATATQIIATVPAGTTTGSITVDVGANTATSANNIEICSSSELVLSDIVIQNTAGASSYWLSMKITNLGSVNVDMTKILIQNYASTDAIVGNDASSGGYFLVNGPTSLAPGDSYSMVNFNFNLGSGRNTTTHPYAVITLNNPDGSVVECHTSDNIVVKQFN